MKSLISNYTFNAATKQVTLTDYVTVSLESLLLITNVTSNTIIYNFAEPNKGATISGNILTLDFDTTSMSNSDKLQIFLDNGLSPAKDETLVALKDVADYLKVLVSQTKTLGTQDTSQRIRVNVDGWGLSSTTTLGYVRLLDANGASYATVNGNSYLFIQAIPDVWKFTELSHMCYQSNIRSKLTF